MSTYKVWTSEEIANNLKTSDAWMARAIYILGSNFDELSKKHGISDKKADRTFFISFFNYFKENSHFTPRQIKLGRAKIREQYIEVLKELANLNESSIFEIG